VQTLTKLYMFLDKVMLLMSVEWMLVLRKNLRINDKLVV
jgi:hypothetical protein